MAKVLTIRDIRLHWPDAERRLRTEGELVVTRDGRPVARLVPYEPRAAARPRWSADEHLEWLARTWKTGAPGPSTDELLSRDRDE